MPFLASCSSLEAPVSKAEFKAQFAALENELRKQLGEAADAMLVCFNRPSPSTPEPPNEADDANELFDWGWPFAKQSRKV